MKSAFFPTAVFVLLFSACATTPPSAPPVGIPPPPPATAYEDPAIDALRARARTLLEVQAKLVWRAWTGGESADLAKTYDYSTGLFSEDTVKLIRQARLESTGADALALERLELYFAGETLAQRTEDVTIAVMQAQKDAVLDLSAGPRPWRHLEQLLAAEASAANRAALLAAEAPVVERLTELVVARNEELEVAIRELGWPSVTDYALQLRGASRASLIALAEATLEQTTSLYEQTMSALSLRELALPLTRVRRADMPRLLRSTSTEDWFPASTSIATATGVPAGLGLDIASRKGVTFETGSELRRRARPLCVSVSPPTDVRMSMKRVTGLYDLRLALRELSCALSNTAPSTPQWELRALAPSRLGDTWAYLFEAPTRTPVWLSMHGVPDDVRSHIISDGAARRLYALRLDAARLLFAMGDKPKDPAATWRALASRAAGFELTEQDGARWALEQDAFIDSADRIRAQLLAAQINRHFMEQYSAMWWTSEKAGAQLESWWAQGGALTLPALAEQLNLGEPGPDALVSTLLEQVATR